MTLDLPPGFWLDSVDSTQDEARRLIAAGRISGTAFVYASHQTAGRGTKGRVWSSPKDRGVYLSVVHRAPQNEGFVVTPIYTMAAGVACVEALLATTGVKVALKPINDLYVDGQKLGGILVESDVASYGLTSLITGIGINTHTEYHTLDRPVVTPVALEALMAPDAFLALNLDTVVETLVAKVCFWYGLVFSGQEGQVSRAWERHVLPELA